MLIYKTSGFSGDGDSRILKAMKILTNLYGGERSKFSWFTAKTTPELICIQDSVHVLGKLKNRILSTTLSFGHYKISSALIIDVINRFSKERHNLTISEVKSCDRMNFKIIEKLLDEKFIECCTSTPGAEGLMQFLNLMNAFKDAFQSLDLTILDRIYKCGVVVFVVRNWRNHNKKNSIDSDFFITSNAYDCIELNFHALIHLVYYFRDNSIDPNLFNVHILNSQMNEEFFRLLRSLTSVFFTMVNFCLKQMADRVHRINFLQETMDNLKEELPRLNETMKKSKNLRLENHIPTDEEISSIVQAALDEAVNICNSVGIECFDSWEYPNTCDIDVDIKNTETNEEFAEKSEEESFFDNVENMLEMDHLLGRYDNQYLDLNDFTQLGKNILF